jgi:hypothetical protein
MSPLFSLIKERYPEDANHKLTHLEGSSRAFRVTVLSARAFMETELFLKMLSLVESRISIKTIEMALF